MQTKKQQQLNEEKQTDNENDEIVNDDEYKKKKKLTCSKISRWYFSQLEREDYNNCRKKDEKEAKNGV